MLCLNTALWDSTTPLGVPVVPTVAVRRKGLDELKTALDEALFSAAENTGAIIPKERGKGLRKQAKEIASRAIVSETAGRRWSERRLTMPVSAGCRG